ATGVAVNTSITLTLNKPVNPTTVNIGTVQAFVSGISGNLAGSYSASGNQVTFTPTTALPGNTRIIVQANSPLQDVAGNQVIIFSSSFTTGAGTDTVAPQVVSVTPADGATNIGQNVSVVLVFSKSINPATLSAGVNGTVGLLDGSGVPLSRA